VKLGSWPTMKPQRKLEEIRPLKGVILRVDIPTGVAVVDRLAEAGLKCPDMKLPKPEGDPPEHPELSYIVFSKPVRQLTTNGLCSS